MERINPSYSYRNQALASMSPAELVHSPARVRLSHMTRLLIPTALVGSCVAFGLQQVEAYAQEPLVSSQESSASASSFASASRTPRTSALDKAPSAQVATDGHPAATTGYTLLENDELPRAHKDSARSRPSARARDLNSQNANTSASYAQDTISGTLPDGNPYLLKAQGLPSLDAHWVRNDDARFSYRKDDGSLARNEWIHDAEGWHYFDDAAGAVTGWFKTPSGKWFYFDTKNMHPTMTVGACTPNGYTYWIDENQGLLYNDWVHNADGSWFRTDEWGILVSGWYQTPNGKWFYFSPSDHKMVVGDCFVNGYHYWIDENQGLLYNDWIKTPSGKWMHTDQWGILASGWFKTFNYKWFYFDPKDFTAVIGPCKTDGVTYFIDESKGLLYNCDVTINGRLAHVDYRGIVTMTSQTVDPKHPDAVPASTRPLADKLLKVATGEIGYRADDDPEPGSKYGRWMADYTGTDWLRGPSSSVWWCAIFVSWCFNQAQIDWNVLPSYNCDQILSRARSYGNATVLDDPHNCKKGDVVLYDFNGNGSCDHIGIIESNNGDCVTAIEGNTHPDDSGSQNAGNGVWRRNRSFDVIRAVIRPDVMN